MGIHVEKINLYSHITLYKHFRWIVDLKVKSKIITLLEYDLYDLVIGKDFPNRILKKQ